jgi:hypothetical protein
MRSKKHNKGIEDFYTQNTRKKIYTEPLLTTKAMKFLSESTTIKHFQN